MKYHHQDAGEGKQQRKWWSYWEETCGSNKEAEAPVVVFFMMAIMRAMLIS